MSLDSVDGTDEDGATAVNNESDESFYSSLEFIILVVTAAVALACVIGIILFILTQDSNNKVIESGNEISPGAQKRDPSDNKEM